MKRPPLVDIARAASVLGVLGLLVVLASLLPSPGYGVSRLSLFVLIGAVAIFGGIGALLERPALVGGSGVGVFLLGFWQAVLGVFMLPVAVVLVLTAFIVDDAGEEGIANSDPDSESA